MTLTLCLITDRRRLLAAVGADSAWRPLLLAQIEGAIAGGVDVVQVREPDLEGAALVDLVRDCVALARGTGVDVLVNDRCDVALAAVADGVHLRENSVPATTVRAIAPQQFIVGRSLHAPPGAMQLEATDYFIAGHVFDTVSKPGTPGLGLARVRDIVVAVGDRPVWAIGGITAEHLAALRECGVAGVAAIGAFIPQAGVVPADAAALSAAVRRLTGHMRSRRS